jgi:hypothetical protein
MLHPSREQAVAYLEDRLTAFLYHYLELLGVKRRGNKEASSYMEDELRTELHVVCATALNARVALREIPARLGEVVQVQLDRMRRGEIDARFLVPADITDLETIAEQLQAQTFFQGKLALPRRA